MKKGQIQMMETISILFIFFILVIVGVLFYSNFAKSNISEQIDKFQELSKIQIVQIASSLPELQCSQENIVEPNCFDLMKVEAAVDIINSDNYFDLLSYSKITLKEVFPFNREWVVYERKKEDADKLSSYFPISLYDAKSQYYRFGVLIIEVYK